MSFTVHRLPNNPIITPDMDQRIGTNINGPSLIRVPDWLPDPLGKYYLYFAHHSGKFIRLAYADALDGPWTVYTPGVLALEDTGCRGHVASPDVMVNHDTQQIEMYYHGPVHEHDRDQAITLVPDDYPWPGSQCTRLATSSDGLHFTDGDRFILPYYTRAFDYEGYRYQVTMPGMVYRSKDPAGPYEYGNWPFFEDFRHPAVWRDGHTLYVFFSKAHDEPEHIVYASIDLRQPWGQWKAGPVKSLITPELDWEGANEPVEPSRRGAVHSFVHQLRDPGIFEDDGKLYLLYSVGGESGLAIAELKR